MNGVARSAGRALGLFAVVAWGLAGCGPAEHARAVEGTPGAGRAEDPRAGRGVVAYQGRCFIAYVPGMGHDRSPGVATDTERRNYWRRSAGDSYGDFVTWSSGERDPASGCSVLVTGYDGEAAFWDRGAAGQVAAQINAFISAEGIREGELILVAHSMGGVVARWILNQGVPGALYFNHEGADFARVVSRTRYLVTVASPHLGSPAADQVYGTGATLCGNFVGWVAAQLGYRSRAAEYLRRVTMEHASASGGWLGDVARTRTIYTVATRRWDSGNGMVEDRLLSGAWWCMGLSDCRWNCTETPGDGLVTEASGRGQFERAGREEELAWEVGQWVQGRRVDWLRIDHNHNHARFDDLRRPIRDLRAGMDTTGFPGSYLGAHGRALE